MSTRVESAPGNHTGGAKGDRDGRQSHGSPSPPSFATLAEYCGLSMFGLDDMTIRAEMGFNGLEEQPAGAHWANIWFAAYAATSERGGGRWLTGLDQNKEPPATWHREHNSVVHVHGLDRLFQAPAGVPVFVTSDPFDWLLLRIGARVEAVCVPDPTGSRLHQLAGLVQDRPVIVIQGGGIPGEHLKIAFSDNRSMRDRARFVHWPSYAGVDTIRESVGRLLRDHGEGDDLRDAFTHLVTDSVKAGAPIVAPSAAAGDPGRYRIRRASEVYDLPPIEWMIEGLLPVEAFGVLYGASGTCKSFLALDMALCIATGEPFHGRNVRGGPIIYIQAESPRGLAPRVKAWCDLHGLSTVPEGFNFLPAAPALVDIGDTASLQEAVRVSKAMPFLLVIDTLHRCYGRDENTSQDMGLFIRNVNAIIGEYGASALVIHHSGYAEDSRERGSSALRGAADLMLPVRLSGDTVTIGGKGTKVKDAEEPRAFCLKKTPCSGSLVLMDTDPPPDAWTMGKQGEIYAYLKEHPKGVRFNAITAAGFPKVTTHRALTALEAAGVVTQELGLWQAVPSVPNGSIGSMELEDNSVPCGFHPLRGGTMEPILEPSNGTKPEPVTFGDPFADDEEPAGVV